MKNLTQIHKSRVKKENGYTTLSKEEKRLYHSIKLTEHRKKKKDSNLIGLNLVKLSCYELMMGVE